MINNEDSKNIYIEYKNKLDKNNISNLLDILNSNSEIESDDYLEVNSNSIDLNKEEEISDYNTNNARARKRKHNYDENDNDNEIEKELNDKKNTKKFFI